MPSAHFFSNLIPVPKLLRKPKSLIQPNSILSLCSFLPLLFLLNRLLPSPLPPSQHGLYMPRWRRRPEESPGSRISARRRRRLLREQGMSRTWSVERKKRRLFSGIALNRSSGNLGFRHRRFRVLGMVLKLVFGRVRVGSKIRLRGAGPHEFEQSIRFEIWKMSLEE
uniref:Uncharacterized protein n=1 Tax=Opuntia streptacantha TaxID=393608 RepID=A0A7C9AW84_OPUST